MNQINVSTSDGVMQILFNRPERKNALTEPMYEAITQAFEVAARQEDTRVVVFSGTTGVFTAGNDLDDFIRNPPKDADAAVFRFLRALATFPKPVIAAVEGLAIGVGTTMLLHCDLVYAASDARFALPFVTLGLVPEAAASLLLPRLAGHQRAAEKLLFGDPFPATDALALGFINRLMPATEVLPHAMQQAARLARLPAGSLQGTKSLMKGQADVSPAGSRTDVLERMEQEIRLFAERVRGPAAREAIDAFKAKRAPNFAGLE